MPATLAALPPTRAAPARACSLLCFRRNDFLHQRFETPIAAERVEEWIDLKGADVCTVPLFKAALQPSHGFVFVTKTEMQNRAGVGDDFAPLRNGVEFSQCLARGLFVAGPRFCRCPLREYDRSIVGLFRLFELCDRIAQVAFRLITNRERFVRISEARV